MARVQSTPQKIIWSTLVCSPGLIFPILSTVLTSLKTKGDAIAISANYPRHRRWRLHLILIMGWFSQKQLVRGLTFDMVK